MFSISADISYQFSPKPAVQRQVTAILKNETPVFLNVYTSFDLKTLANKTPTDANKIAKK